MPQPKAKQNGCKIAKAKDASNQTTMEVEVKQTTDEVDAPRTGSNINYFTQILKLFALTLLAAIYSAASQLNLSPVYGAIPASKYHNLVVNCAIALGLSPTLLGRSWTSRKLLSVVLPVLAFWIPVIQHFLFGWSGTLGAIWGPFMTEVLTIFPLITLAVASSTSCLADVDGWVAMLVAAMQGLIMLGSFEYLEMRSGALMSYTPIISDKLIYTRVGYEVTVATGFALLSPAPIIVLALPAILHTVFLNPHAHTRWGDARLNSTLERYGFELLARKDSVTGYISVLESKDGLYRVMRCDHSILGGDWVLPRGDALVSEPIYAIFTMLEAVRLVEVPESVPDKEARALVIGGGVGTAPGALQAHGINTTIIEIDPIVMKYATEYFNLKPNNPPIIYDAVAVLQGIANNPKLSHMRYDYIIHDVFTGGAEPVDLFTVSFLRNLHKALTPHGVIAINYASDLLQPSTHLILRTILSVFPACRIYRELPKPSPKQVIADGQDFTNMVMFCRASTSGGWWFPSAPLSFREPVTADFLGSGARQGYLVPQHEISLESILTEAEEVLDREDWDVLTRENRGRLEETQKKSAIGHWRVMRTVLPEKVWELW